MNATAIIAEELAAEIRQRYCIDVNAVGTLNYDLMRPHPPQHAQQIENFEILINSYTISGRGFSILIGPDEICLTTHVGDPTIAGPTDLENIDGEKWAKAIAKFIKIGETIKYDLGDPKSVDAILDKLGEILNGQIRSEGIRQEDGREEDSRN